MLQIPCFSPQSSEPRWPEGGARGKNWQEDRWVAREQVDETSTKKTKLVKHKYTWPSLTRTALAGITPLTPEQDVDRGTSAEIGTHCEVHL